MKTDGGNTDLICGENRVALLNPLQLHQFVGQVQDLCYFRQQGFHNEQFKEV
jgi:hypothetical protein